MLHNCIDQQLFDCLKALLKLCHIKNIRSLEGCVLVGVGSVASSGV